MVTELEVVDQVLRRPTMRRVGGGDLCRTLHRCCQHRITHRTDVHLQRLQLATLLRSGTFMRRAISM